MDEIEAFVGSHNLTRGGLTDNDELCIWTEFRPAVVPVKNGFRNLRTQASPPDGPSPSPDIGRPGDGSFASVHFSSSRRSIRKKWGLLPRSRIRPPGWRERASVPLCQARDEQHGSGWQDIADLREASAQEWTGEALATDALLSFRVVVSNAAEDPTASNEATRAKG
ncbi:MAG: hypothetical protein HY318_11605 [Armatimonadetes bacterium]|nr:hypothetical protein [Armatimonadota bacterium]